MAKVRTTVAIDEVVLRQVKVLAARLGTTDGQVIEDAVRRDLGLDVLRDVWANAKLEPDAAMELALEAQRATRRDR